MHSPANKRFDFMVKMKGRETLRMWASYDLTKAQVQFKTWPGVRLNQPSAWSNYPLEVKLGN